MPSYHTYLYFIFNALAGVLILFGFNVLNIFELQDIYSGLLDSTFIDIDAQQLYSFNFGLILLFLGFFIKLGLAPFHF